MARNKKIQVPGYGMETRFLGLCRDEIECVKMGLKTIHEALQAVKDLADKSIEGHSQIRDEILKMAEETRKRYKNAKSKQEQRQAWNDFKEMIDAAREEQRKITVVVDETSDFMIAGAVLGGAVVGIAIWRGLRHFKNHHHHDYE